MRLTTSQVPPNAAWAANLFFAAQRRFAAAQPPTEDAAEIREAAKHFASVVKGAARGMRSTNSVEELLVQLIRRVDHTNELILGDINWRRSQVSHNCDVIAACRG